MTVIVIDIEMPGGPVAKARPKFARGRAYTPTKTTNYESALGLMANKAMAGKKPFECAVAVRVVVRLPIPALWPMTERKAAIEGLTPPIKRPDLDNYIKAIFDALNKIVFRDDSQVVELSARKIYAAEPGVRVEIAPLSSEVVTAFRPMLMNGSLIGEVA